jgi:hypothetical protein
LGRFVKQQTRFLVDVVNLEQTSSFSSHTFSSVAVTRQKAVVADVRGFAFQHSAHRRAA